MNRSTLAIAALAFGFAAVAAAQAPVNPATNPGSQKVAPPLQFSVLDTNKDGRVSKDEVRTHAELMSSFGSLDADSDTYLTELEFAKWKQKPGAMPPGDATTAPGNSSGTAPRSPPANR